MQKELDNNIEKGSIFNWNPSFQNWLYEFEYHKSKLIAAIMCKDRELQYEFAADLGNYLSLMLFKEFNIQESITLCENEKTKII